MARVGRPIKEDARRGRFEIRLNDKESEALNRRCKETGMSKADVIRSLIFAADKKKGE